MLCFKVNQGGSIGIVMATNWFEPLRDIPVDHLATQRAIAYEVAW